MIGANMGKFRFTSKRCDAATFARAFVMRCRMAGILMRTGVPRA